MPTNDPDAATLARAFALPAPIPSRRRDPQPDPFLAKTLKAWEMPPVAEAVCDLTPVHPFGHAQRYEEGQ